MGKRGWIDYRGAVFGAAIGNALVGFASFFEPTRPSVESIEKVRSPRLQDRAGDSPVPEAPGAFLGPRPAGGSCPREVSLPTVSGKGHLAGIDLDDSASLLDLVDDRG
jgi:hypothetical protein